MSARANSLLLLLPAGLVLAGCAAISSPEGGPRDQVAPKLVSTDPKNGATNVKQQNLRLTFSEPVQLKELTKNLLITPSIPEENPYKIREERNSVELRFDKPLDANTTYVFNFRDAVTDITESNPARDVIVAFSTGAALDSGRVSGSVTQLLSGQPEADITVALYPAGDTTDVRRHRPYYQTRSDKSGNFQLRNLREGSYRIYALLDKNNNSRYDEPERIAYLPAPITIQPRLDSVRLVTVRPDSKRPLILSQQTAPTQFKIGYNEGLRQFTLAALGQAPSPALLEATVLQERGRSVVIQRSELVPAGRYLIAATDSAGNAGVDTVNVRFEGQAAPARRGAQYQVVGAPREVYRQGQIKLQFVDPVRILSTKPFGTLVEDSLTRRPLRLPADGTLSPDRTQLAVNVNTKAKKTVTFIPDSTAILAVGGQSLRLRPVRLRVSEQSSTGTLSGTVQTTARSFELQLLDQGQQVVRSLSSPRTFRFDNLDPGTYTLRVLIDADNDGRWRGGDPKLIQPAEPVYLFPTPQQVRANWEIENLQLNF
jgi:Bacterial Ig-like domain